MLKDSYTAASRGPIFPDRIEGEGMLVGWSMEQAHLKRQIGFQFGDSLSRSDDHLIDPILFGAEGHLITIAATGAGKGVGCIIPALLTHPGPMIVIDPKGENAAVTRRFREETLGQQVHIIDPMGITGAEAASLNPLDCVDPADRACVDEAAALADLLAGHFKDDARNRFWHNRAQHLVTALICHAVSSPERSERNLPAVRDKLTMASAGDHLGLSRLLQDSPHPEARRASGAFGVPAQETLGSIISTAQDMVDFLRGEPVRQATSSSSFDLDAVTRGDPMTIYIVLPPHMLESHAQLLRLWVGTLLKAIIRRRHKAARSTMLLLDEAAQLGEFPPLRQAITLLRGYGLQTWSFWQDVDQLRHSYPTSWRTIINNCRVVQAFGAPNMSAAASLAELFVLMNPARILDLADDEMIVQISGDDAFLARRPNYLIEPAFAGKFDPNPFYEDAPPVESTPVKRRENVYLRQGEDEGSQGDDALIADLLRRFG